MPDLLDKIKVAVADSRFLVSWHAQDQCDQRGVSPWQLVAGLDQAAVKRVRPSSKPNPSVVVCQMLADGTSVEVVWAWLGDTGRAKLVTVYFQ
jgi:hypothetical protein